MIKTSKKDLYDCLSQFEIPKNHIYIIHSSVLKFGIFEGGAKGILEVLYEVLGNSATILMPTFTFNYATTKTWDYHASKSEAGALTEFFRKQNTTKRTLHPFHSLAVSGPQKELFLKNKNLSSFGPGSPFEVLYEHSAINIALGIGLVGGATFLHHAEEVANVPYRYHKDFPGVIIDENGKNIEKVFKMFVRKITPEYEFCNTWDHVLPEYRKFSLVQEKKINGADVLVFNIKQCHDHILSIMEKNPYFIAKKVIK